MKKGDIIYFNPLARNNCQSLEDKKHPIICLEDVNCSKDSFHSVILSSSAAPTNSNIQNIELDMNYFDNNPNYKVPGKHKHEFLVSMGIWKEIPQLPENEDGKISIQGLIFILCELLKHTPQDKQEELYSKLFKLVRDYVPFEYVTTDIKTHIINNNLQKQ